MGEPVWLEPALDGPAPSGCLNCPGKPNHLPLGARLGVGFGMCQVTKDNDLVWSEAPDDPAPPVLSVFEAMAAVDPDHDWRCEFIAPLYEAEYQRHGDGLWVLIRRGEGFA